MKASPTKQYVSPYSMRSGQIYFALILWLVSPLNTLHENASAEGRKLRNWRDSVRTSSPDLLSAKSTSTEDERDTHGLPSHVDLSDSTDDGISDEVEGLTAEQEAKLALRGNGKMRDLFRAGAESYPIGRAGTLLGDQFTGIDRMAGFMRMMANPEDSGDGLGQLSLSPDHPDFYNEGWYGYNEPGLSPRSVLAHVKQPDFSSFQPKDNLSYDPWVQARMVIQDSKISDDQRRRRLDYLDEVQERVVEREEELSGTHESIWDRARGWLKSH